MIVRSRAQPSSSRSENCKVTGFSSPAPACSRRTTGSSRATHRPGTCSRTRSTSSAGREFWTTTPSPRCGRSSRIGSTTPGRSWPHASRAAARSTTSTWSSPACSSSERSTRGGVISRRPPPRSTRLSRCRTSSRARRIWAACTAASRCSVPSPAGAARPSITRAEALRLGAKGVTRALAHAAAGTVAFAAGRLARGRRRVRLGDGRPRCDRDARTCPVPLPRRPRRDAGRPRASSTGRRRSSTDSPSV